MISLNRKYRPQTWEDVCAQESIVKILSKQIETGKFAHAYIFAGVTGSGKTTTARIFASKLNRGLGTPIEIDAASHSGADDIRAIVEDAPNRAYDCDYKIYIIDEAHTISSQGWDAFLKCIEEPPEYTIFIFCTTELKKVRESIKNRCQKFIFGAIPTQTIVDRLKYICKQEGFTNYDDGVEYLAKIANGSMRNAITNLEVVASNSTQITVKNINESIDRFSIDTMIRMLNRIVSKDRSSVLKGVDYIYHQGKDLKNFVDQFYDFVLDMTKYVIFKDISMTGIPSVYLPKNGDDADVVYKKAREDMSVILSTTEIESILVKMLDILTDLKLNMKSESSPQSMIEVYFMRCSSL